MVIFVVIFYHTKHYKYRVIFTTFIKSWNQYLFVNPTIQNAIQNAIQNSSGVDKQGVVVVG